MKHHFKGRNRPRFYLDKENAKLAGVCAGIADHFGWNVFHVRIGWVIATVLWPHVMIIGYILTAWLAQPKPASETGGAAYGVGSPPPEPPPPSHRRLADAKSRFERLEARLRALESVVTSREFQMDRELKA